MGPGLTAFAMYNDFGAVKNSTLVFVDFPAGNSTYNADANCNLPAPAVPTRCYMFDYNIFEVGLQYDFKIGSMPAMVWGNYAENEDPSTLNSAYNLGFQIGKADPGLWELATCIRKSKRTPCLAH